MPASLTITYYVVVIISLLIAMTIHEFMHAYVGYRLGDITAHEQGRISLNPLHHIDPFMTVLLPAITLLLFHFPVLAAKPVPFNPYRIKYGEYGAALLAFAGPFSNLVLAIIGAIILHPISNSSLLAQSIGIFVWLNVILFVFNLIPIPPLDGSRVLYAFAPEPVQEFMQRIEPMGLFIIFAIILLGGFGGFLLHIDQSILNLLHVQI